MAHKKRKELFEKYEFVSNIPLTDTSKAQVIYNAFVLKKICKNRKKSLTLYSETLQIIIVLPQFRGVFIHLVWVGFFFNVIKLLKTA